MSDKTNGDYADMCRAMASAEYRALKTDNEKMACLLFDFSIPRSLVGAQFGRSKDQMYRFVKAKGKMREKGGRPKLLTPEEEERLLAEILRNAQQMTSLSRSGIQEAVCFY